MMILDDREKIAGLRRQWLAVAAFYMAAVLLGYGLALQAWSSARALQWASLAGVTVILQMLILWRILPSNRRQGDAMLLPFLGYANSVTLIRGILICLLAGFLFAPLPTGALAWAPALLYTLDRVIDLVDGAVARITNGETKMGEILDIEFDGLGVLIAVTLAVQYDKLPAWYLVLGLSRQLFVGGMWLLERLGRQVHDLPPSDHRRLIAGFQTGFISVALWPVLNSQVTMLASYVFAIPLVFSFVRDWLVVSGTVDPESKNYQAARKAIKQVIEGWLPVAARLVAAAISIVLLWQHATTPNALAPQPLLAFLIFLWSVAALLLLLGIAGRVAALLLFGLTSMDIFVAGLDWMNGLLLVCTVVVVHLGSGKFALWQPEERMIRTKLGAASASKS